MRTLHLLIFVFALLPLVSGCTKKRPDRFAQGQGINLDAVADFQDKTFWLKTGGALAPANSTKSDNLNVQESVTGFNNFPLVQYTTNSDLLGNDLPFRGRPNFTYEIRYRLTDNYLKIYKVGKKEDIPFAEWTYAETMNDGRLAVPLVGYGIQSYVRVENARNGDNEKTHIQIEIPEKTPGNASHFKIDRLNRMIFSAVDKVDVYPADYFRGEWFYSETTIDTKVGQEKEIGGVGGVDTNLSMASRIRILLNSNSYMRGANVNIDERLDKKDDLSYEYVFNIPIAWKEYRAVRQGKQSALSEEEVLEQIPTKRPFVKIDFESLITTSNELTSALSIFNRILGVQKVVDIQFSPDFFSFTLLKVATGSRVKYSFLRAKDRQYRAVRRHFKDDRKLYGYFTTSRKVIFDRDFQRREDFERNIFLNRFDPEQDIVFHFTTNTPKKKWIRDVGRAAVHYWNRAFELAGTKARVRIDESNDVALGDIRYNTLNFLYSITGSNLNGFGPSLTDPFTGEIITATTNIHINSKLDMLASDIRDYMRNKIGLHGYVSQITGISLDSNPQGDAASIFMEPRFVWKGDDVPPAPMSIQAWQGPEFERTTEEPLSRFKDDMELTRLVKAMDGRGEIRGPWDAFNRFRSLFKKIPDLDTVEGMRDRALRNGTTSMIARRIETKCTGVLGFIKEVRQSGMIDTSKEKSVIENCIQIISFPYLLGVTLHEMGHNLGLRHNFFASSDLNNFYTPAEVEKLFGLKMEKVDIPLSASVMDYPAWGEETRFLPGKYDIAAIRFGYADAIELSNGEIKKVDVNRSIKDNLGGNLSALKSHKFCTDEDAILQIDPLCQRWDHGATPEEVVDYIIKSYWSSLVTDNYRYDRIMPNQMGPFVRARGVAELKRYYDQWRIHLAEFMGVGREYLEMFTPDQRGVTAYRQTLKRMSEHPIYGKYFAQYYNVSRKIFNFLMQASFISNRYCVTKKADGSLFLTELSKARFLVYRNGQQYTRTCSDPGVKQHLAQQGLTLVGEIGHDLNTVRYSMDVKDMTEPPDVLGTLPDRLNAMGALTMRVINPLNLTRKVFPSFLDEPDLQNILVQNLMVRVLYGADLGADLKRIKGLETLSEDGGVIPTFESESGLIAGYFDLLKEGLMVPGKRSLSQRNLMSFTHRATQDREVAQRAMKEEQAEVIPIPGAFLIATPENRLMYALFKEVKEVSALEELPTLEFDEAKVNAIKAKIAAFVPQTPEQPFTGEMLDGLMEVFKGLNPRENPLEMTMMLELFKMHLGIREAVKKDPGLQGPTPHGNEVGAGSIAEAFKSWGITDLTNLDYNMITNKMAGAEPLTMKTVEAFLQEKVEAFAMLRRVDKSEISAKKELLMKLIMSE